MNFVGHAATPTEDSKLLPGAERLCGWLVTCIAVTIGLTGLSNLAVWYVPGFQDWAAGVGMMVVRVNTAFSIVAGSLSLLMWRLAGRWRGAVAAAQLLAFVPLLMGGLTSLEYFAGLDLRIDQMLAPGSFPGDLAVAAVVSPGRMSLNASLALFALGLSLALLDWVVVWRGKPRFPAPGLAMLGSLPAFLGMVGYLLGQGGFTGILRSTNILFHAAACMLLMAVASLLLRPLRQPVRGLLSAGADGVLLRLLLPGATVALLAVAAAIGQGTLRGYVQPGEGAAVMLFGGLVLLFALFGVAGRAVRHQEERAIRTAEALHEKERLSELVLETALDGVVLMNSAGQVLDWNTAAERIFGRDRSEMVGSPLVGPVVSETALAELTQRLGARQFLGPKMLGKRLEVEALRRDGTTFPAEFVLNALEGTATPLFVAYVRDITDQRADEDALKHAKERAERASQAKDDFLAALSHELRTPLTPVLLSAGTLAEDPSLPEEVRRELSTIARHIGLEARLIDDLLDLTRIAKGKLLLRVENADLHDLLGHAVEIIRDEAQGRRQKIELRLEAERSWICGDPARLQQVFWNLLKNAVKFTDPGGSIVITTRDGEDGWFNLEVWDTGVGFTAETAERLFVPFEQGVLEGDRQFGGLGLGLAIARAIVELHGGRITGESGGTGAGATFKVYLPNATEPVAKTTRSLGPLDDAGWVNNGPLRILLVEDHEVTRKMLAQLLVRHGNTVQVAGTLAEAMSAMEGDGYDIVVSDLGLPDGSGLDLMPRLRARHPHLKGIALSGYGMEEDLQRSSEAGFAAHLVKPIKFDQLKQALQQVRGSN